LRNTTTCSPTQDSPGRGYGIHRLPTLWSRLVLDVNWAGRKIDPPSLASGIWQVGFRLFLPGFAPKDKESKKTVITGDEIEI